MTSATSSSSTTSQLPASDGSSDPHQWLEEVTGEEALAWVSERNQRAEAELEAVADPAAPQGPPLAETLQREIREILDAKDKIPDRKSTRLNSSHVASSYAVFCLS